MLFYLLVCLRVLSVCRHSLRSLDRMVDRPVPLFVLNHRGSGVAVVGTTRLPIGCPSTKGFSSSPRRRWNSLYCLATVGLSTLLIELPLLIPQKKPAPLPHSTCRGRRRDDGGAVATPPPLHTRSAARRRRGDAAKAALRRRQGGGAAAWGAFWCKEVVGVVVGKGGGASGRRRRRGRCCRSPPRRSTRHAVAGVVMAAGRLPPRGGAGGILVRPGCRCRRRRGRRGFRSAVAAAGRVL